MSVLLGIPDARVENVKATDWATNKIGGTPDWLSGVAGESPRCALCGRPSSLVVQVYCPLSGSPRHRTLHIFACTNKPCWNKQESWSALRSQMLEKSPEKKDANTEKEGHINWGEDADDWGEADTAMTTTDWCEGANDWGEDPVDPATVPRVSPQEAGEPRTVDELSIQAERLEQMALSDNGEACALTGKEIEAEDGESVTECTAESVNMKPVSENLHAVLNVSGQHEAQDAPRDAGADTNSTDLTLVSYYINVFEQPSSGHSENYGHEQRLLAAYVKQEGIDLDDLLHNDQSGRGGGKEGYEKTSARHGDQTFLKFTKRLQACPQQVIRYEYAGQAVYMRRPQSGVVPACPRCAQPRVYEMQLMPALVPLLSFANSQGEALELGTVLVYTCRANCWDDALTTPLHEHVIVQADPDDHLFR